MWEGYLGGSWSQEELAKRWTKVVGTRTEVWVMDLGNAESQQDLAAGGE